MYDGDILSNVNQTIHFIKGRRLLWCVGVIAII